MLSCLSVVGTCFPIYIMYFPSFLQDPCLVPPFKPPGLMKAVKSINYWQPKCTGPPPRLAEAGAGPRAVEGGCQLVLASSVLVDTSLLSFSFSFSL